MKTLKPQDLGIAGNGRVYRNLATPRLVEKALERGEGVLTETGAFAVQTGKYTGRSPHDKFIVDTPAVHDDIAWGKVNVPISQENMRALKGRSLHISRGRSSLSLTASAGPIPSIPASSAS